MNNLNQPLEVIHGDCGFTSLEEASKCLFGEMRHSTEEENELYRQMLDRLSVQIDSNVSIFDL